MVNDFPISFEYRGEKYTGVFTRVSGAGSTAYFHLMINNYYRGQFFYSEASQKWTFGSNNGMFEDLADFFEAFLISANQ